jgi:hypothetical protein
LKHCATDDGVTDHEMKQLQRGAYTGKTYKRNTTSRDCRQKGFWV